MHISGSGHIPAGEYNDKISVSGSGSLDGNVRCTAFSASGSAHCAGSLACTEDVRVSGSAHIGGGVTATSLSVSGSAHIGGDLTVKETARVAGSVKVGGEIKSGAVHSAGSLRVEKGIEAEEFRAAGAIDCGGLLNAETVDISMDGNARSRVGSIGGGEIRVYLRKSDKTKKRRLPLLSRLVGLGGSELTVNELVEGDVVALECVKVPTVVGRVVAIGVGCEIDLVQYSEEVEIDPDAKVGRCEKV